MAQHTIQVPINKMTYVDYNNPNTSYLGQTTSKLGGQNIFVPSVYSASKILFLQYELSYPGGKKYINHKLCMYSVGEAATGTRLQYADNVYIDWSNPTYNNFGGPPSGYLIYKDIPTNAWLQMPSLTDGRLGPRTFKMSEYRQADTSPNFEFNTHTAMSNKPYVEITYEDVPPDAPTLIDPIGAYKDNKSIIRLGWKYNSSVGGIQKAFDLQWSADGITWNTINQTTANNYYDIPANTFPSSNIYWRVRCYNEYNEVSPYSSTAAFYSIGAPPVPVINTIATDTARPTINWASSQQQIYQVQIVKAEAEAVVYDSGNIPAIMEKTHKIKTFLPDGAYTARVRVKNEYDIWSAWGEREFTINTVKPSKPSFTLYNKNYGLLIDITSVQGVAYYLVYRSELEKDDYTCIIKTNELKCIDNTGINNKEYKYFVRAVTVAETYQDSDIKIGKSIFKYSLIAPVSDINSILILKYGLNKPPTRNAQRNLPEVTAYYSGRQYAVIEFSEHIESVLTFEFVFKTYAEVEQFMDLYDNKETMLYRDSKGRKLYGSFGGLSVSDERSKYIVAFTITQTNYEEGVEV